MDIAIGTKFHKVGRMDIDRVYTVIDIHKTYNTKGEMVKTRYVAESEFCGQTVIENDILKTTILRGKI